MEVADSVEVAVAEAFGERKAGVEFGRGDLIGGGVDEAELTGGEIALLGARGRPEGAAEDGAMAVECAGARGRVEDGAGLVVGEVVEEVRGLGVLVEDAGDGVAREVRRDPIEGGGYTGTQLAGAGGVFASELVQTIAKASGILVGYGEDAVAALGASGMADEMGTSAAVGVGGSGIYDLDEVGRHLASRRGMFAVGEGGNRDEMAEQEFAEDVSCNVTRDAYAEGLKGGADASAAGWVVGVGDAGGCETA